MRKKIVLLVSIGMTLLAGCSYVSSESSKISADEMRQKYQEMVEQNVATEENAYDSYMNKADAIYYETFDRVTTPEVEDDGMTLSEQVFRAFYRMYLTVRSISPILFLGSMGIGLILFISARNNKGIRKVGLYGFMIGIPLFLILFTYGIGILLDMFVF